MSNLNLGLKDVAENPESVFYLLNREEKEQLQHHISFTRYKKNEIIFKEGDKPNSFLLLIEGKVKILKEGVGGREQIIRMIRPYGIISYRALLAEENHIATAVTLEETLVCTITLDYIINIALKNSDFSTKIIRKLSKELGFSNSRSVTLTQKHIRGRLAESLLLLKDKYGYEQDGTTLKVYLSREDIANLSNMTTSNAIRTLSTFANEQIIAIDGRKIKILNHQRLERVSNLG